MIRVDSARLLLDALSVSGAVYVLGAGASAPEIPTIAQIPRTLRSIGPRLSSFPATMIADSPLRAIIGPLVERSRMTLSLEEWKAGALTSATIAVALEWLIARAHWMRMPQYEVFRLIPFDCGIVSFNWDGLARARCRQRSIIHPHGFLRPRALTDKSLLDLLDDAQEFDQADAHTIILPGLVMPGEETSGSLSARRERVFQLWLAAASVVVIGYTFGIGSDLAYDGVWRETFVEAMRVNRSAPIHIISPHAVDLRQRLVDLIERPLSMHAWPLSWRDVASELLSLAEEHNVTRPNQLPVLPRSMAEH